MKYATQSSRTITHAGCLSPKCFPPSILIGELGKLNEKIQKTKQKEKTKEKEKTRHEKCPYTLSSEFWITCSLNSELQSSKCKCKQRDPITLCYELWLSYNTVFFDVVRCYDEKPKWKGKMFHLRSSRVWFGWIDLPASVGWSDAELKRSKDAISSLSLKVKRSNVLQQTRRKPRAVNSFCWALRLCSMNY